MTNDKIINQLKYIIAEELDMNLKQEEIKEDVSLFEEGLGLDSIAVMEFISSIETHFNFQFSDDELSLEPFKNLSTVAQFISGKVETQVNN